jgi:hypothetical protein
MFRMSVLSASSESKSKGLFIIYITSPAGNGPSADRQLGRAFTLIYKYRTSQSVVFTKFFFFYLQNPVCVAVMKTCKRYINELYGLSLRLHVTAIYQVSLSFCSCKILQKSASCFHLQFGIGMVKCKAE